MKSIGQIKNDLYSIRKLGDDSSQKKIYVNALNKIEYEVDKRIAVSFFLNKLSVRKIARQVGYSKSGVFFRFGAIYKQLQFLLEDE